MKHAHKTLVILALAWVCLAVSTVHATPTDRIIIKVSETLRPAVLADGAPAPRARARVSSLSAAVGHEVVYLRAMSGGADVVRLPRAMPLEQVQAMAEAMARLPGVAYAVPDMRMFPADLPEPLDPPPSDPQFTQQWNLQAVSVSDPVNYGIDVPRAWAVTTGNPVTVAVLDTGILPGHLDLVGKLLPGYDFISADSPGVFFTANDGDGRDDDPSDPGDWVTAEEAQTWGCRQSNSSWHGTHVAGTIGAATNNDRGIAGISWGAMILPLRVLGKCGGFLSDIVDAMRWSVGLDVPGIHTNHYPARILNLSLGAAGSCTNSTFKPLRDAIADVNSTDALIIVAAGNEGKDLQDSPISPASCSGVVTVAATTRLGLLASYSSFGSAVDISAPGGNGGAGILSTLDGSPEAPINDSSIGLRAGTSMATAHVSGVAALILGHRPALSREEVIYLVQTHVTEFPEDSQCALNGGCGTGIVNAALALQATEVFDGIPPSRGRSGGGAPSPWLLGMMLAYAALRALRKRRYPPDTAPANAP